MYDISCKLLRIYPAIKLDITYTAVKRNVERINNFRKWRRNMDRKKCYIQTSSSTDTTLGTAMRSSLTANWIDLRQRLRLHLPFAPEEERRVNRAVLKKFDNSSSFDLHLSSLCNAHR